MPGNFGRDYHQAIVINGESDPELMENFAHGLRALLEPVAGLSNPEVVSNLVTNQVANHLYDDENGGYPIESQEIVENQQEFPAPVGVQISLNDPRTIELPATIESPPEPSPKAKVHSITDRFYTHTEEDKVLYKK